MVIRPRRGDLEAATEPHVAVPSGEYVAPGVERCNLCGLAFANRHAHPNRDGAVRVNPGP